MKQIDVKEQTPVENAQMGAPAPPAAPPRRSGPGLGSTFSAFRHRNYQLWFGGQLTSVIGTWMQIIAQGWLVYQLSHSEFALGLVSFASAIPTLIVTPWGGVITDAVPKRTLLVITQATAMLMAFILAVLTFTGVVQVWHIIVLAMVLGVVNAFDAPARQAFVVELVGRDDLPNAIALNSITFNGARMIGPALGGLLLAALGSAWCFFINGVSFLAVIAGLLMMRVPDNQSVRRVEKPLREFIDGVNYARGKREIAGLLLLSAVFGMFGLAYSSLLPAFVDQVLHAGADGYGLINALVGVGAVAGALIIARFSRSGVRGKMMSIANLIYPVVLILFGFNRYLPAALVIALVMGMTFMLQSNNINSLIQLNVSDEMRGRVMSLFTLSFFGLSPFGSLLAGALAEMIPMGWTIALLSVLLLAGSVLILWKTPEIPRMS